MRKLRWRYARRREDGSIAILVLWGVALVFILLAAANFTTRTEIQIARNTIAASRARHAAEGGTQLGLERLLARRAQGTTVFDGKIEPWQEGSTKVEIAIQDEAGKIDINQAPRALLAGLFVAIGRNETEAGLLACRILERRGSVDPGCPSGPAQSTAVFAAPEELAELPGFGDRLYRAVAPFVTVQTGASAIDPIVAQRRVLLAIPGATPELVDEFLSQRAAMRDLAPGSGFDTLPTSPFLMMSPARDFTVSAVATTPEGARYRAELQLRLTGTATCPYQVLAWRTPPPGR